MKQKKWCQVIHTLLFTTTFSLATELNNTTLIENTPHSQKTTETKTFTKAELLQLNYELLQESNAIKKEVLKKTLLNAALYPPNQEPLKSVLLNPPSGKTIGMVKIENLVKNAKKKLAEEKKSNLKKPLEFKDIQFYLLIENKTPPTLQTLEDYAGASIQSLGTLPSHKEGAPIAWKPSPEKIKQKIQKQVTETLALTKKGENLIFLFEQLEKTKKTKNNPIAEGLKSALSSKTKLTKKEAEILIKIEQGNYKTLQEIPTKKLAKKILEAHTKNDAKSQ